MPAMCGWLIIGEDVRLSREARQPVGVGGEQLGEDLQRHVATELCIAGTIDLAHAARAERSGDLV